MMEDRPLIVEEGGMEELWPFMGRRAWRGGRFSIRGAEIKEKAFAITCISRKFGRDELAAGKFFHVARRCCLRLAFGIKTYLNPRSK